MVVNFNIYYSGHIKGHIHYKRKKNVNLTSILAKQLELCKIYYCSKQMIQTLFSMFY